MLALDWLRAATVGGKVKAGCMDAVVRAAVLGAADKAAEVREAGVGLAKQLLEVREPVPWAPRMRDASAGSAYRVCGMWADRHTACLKMALGMPTIPSQRAP